MDAVGNIRLLESRKNSEGEKDFQRYSSRIENYLACSKPSPILVIDKEQVSKKFLHLRKQLSPIQIYYAVKANPDTRLLKVLASLGSCFDVASRPEIERCLALGIAPERLSFGHTLKKREDIQFAFNNGIDLFAFDCAAELEKIASYAPRARVFCRLQISHTEDAAWPLSQKFGCTPQKAAELLVYARTLEVNPIGLSFHVGSQMESTKAWDVALESAALVWRNVAKNGIELSLLNLGGGFPGHYMRSFPTHDIYAQDLSKYISKHFSGIDIPQIIIELGRAVVADSGVLEAEIVLVTPDSVLPDTRWVYLDVGLFNGLMEALGESICYRVLPVRKGISGGPCILAGPTCDSMDILYKKKSYILPKDLSCGDRLRFLSCGAYTSTYASVGFNGFEPLQVEVI